MHDEEPLEVELRLFYVALTRAKDGSPAPDSSLGDGLTSYLFLTANPLDSDVNSALAANPQVHSNFDVGGTSKSLGLVRMKTAYPSDGLGATNTYSINFTQPFDLATFQTPQHLMIGLLEPNLTGSFDALDIVIRKNGFPTIEKTFTTAAAAEAYFDDSTLDFGQLDSTGTLNLGFQLSFTTHTVGSSFEAQMMYGNTTPGSGPAVPEPGGFSLATPCLLVLLCVGARCSRS